MKQSTNHALDETGCELAAEVLQNYGSLRLGVTGWSMFPAVWPGDTICVDRANGDAICEGDIVLFSRDRRLFAHRVVRTTNQDQQYEILTRGDAMPSVDHPVSEKELLGKVTAIVRNGKWMDAQQSPRLFERALSTLIQRSEVASRVVVGVHGLRAASRIPTE